MHFEKVRILCVVLLASACGCSSFSAKSKLDEKLDFSLHQLDSTGAIVGARVLELPSGRELYSNDSDQPLVPASNMKLLATAAALDLWPPEHSFKTYLLLVADDLWVIGTGDPGLGDPQIARKRGGTTVTVLDEWANALKARGVEQIKGRLFYFDNAIESQQVHPTWHKDDLTAWYAAPISGLNFNDNCIDVTIFPTDPGQPVRVEVVPPTKNITIVNMCVTGARGTANIERDPDKNVFTITGGCNARTVLRSRPVTDPGAFFADALRTHLESKGITIAGGTHESIVALPPSPEITVAVHETTLAELLPRINKNSQNLLAEGLCKLVGMEYDRRRGIEQSGSWASADQAVRAFFRKYGIDDSQLVYADGSGLSNQNRVTSRLISDLLLTMDRHPRRQAFFDSLSVGGRDGTISNRFTDVPDKVHAKTGYISGTRALSGYVQTRDGKWLIFSIIYNKIRGGVRPFEFAQDQACRVLMSYPLLDYVPAATRPATTQSSN